MRDHYSYKDYKETGHAANYDQTRFKDPVGLWVHELGTDILEKRLDFSGKSVLDVGAGTGRISIFLSEKGAKVTGLDASQAMLKIFKQKIDDNGLSITIKEGDAHHIPFPEKHFDCVVSFMTIMHVVDWHVMLSEMCRVSNGHIILQFPSKSSYACLSPLVQPVRRIFNKNYQTWRSFFISTIERILERNGFQVEWWHKEMTLPVVLHRNINNLNISRKIEQIFYNMKITPLLGNPVILSAKRKRHK